MKLHPGAFRRGRKTKIRQQLWTVYTLALLLPLTILGLLLLVYTNRLLTQHYLELLRSENLRVKTVLTEITTQAQTVSSEICYDDQLKELLSRDYESSMSFTKAANGYTKLDNQLYNSPQISAIYIYTDNPSVVQYKQFRHATEEITASDWYQKAILQNSGFWVSLNLNRNYSNQNNNLCLIRRVVLPYSQYQAVVVIVISDQQIRAQINSGVIDAVSVDDQGVVYSTKKSWYGTEQLMDIDDTNQYFSYSGKLMVDGTDYFAAVSTANLFMTNSRMYIYSLDNGCIRDIQRIIGTFILILLLAILVPCGILLVYSTYFSERVLLLREEMRKASRKDYDMLTDFSGGDELAEAFQDLKHLVRDIQIRDAKMYESQLTEQELRSKQQLMEYKMLASQINPHYLYNTLETIRMKALTEGNRSVADCIKILAKTLRYVLDNTGTSVTTLQKELDHVENYLKIQQLRFGERINYQIHIQPGLDPARYSILPLLLQPVVENAVEHGLELHNTPGMIHIHLARQEDRLVMSVRDNGVGIPEEKLTQIREALRHPDRKTGSGIALHNISHRIRLRYGDEYGITLKSDPDAGTEVTLNLPARPPEAIS